MKPRQRDNSNIYESVSKKVFVDRNDCRMLFWDSFEKIINPNDESRIAVINYYGIGGQGKSTLLRCLEWEIKRYETGIPVIDIKTEIDDDSELILSEINEKSIHDVPRAVYNFEVMPDADIITILYQLSEGLSKYGLRFPRTLVAYLQYLKVIYREDDETRYKVSKSILSDHKWLIPLAGMGGVLAGEFIGPLGIIGNLIDFIDSLRRDSKLKKELSKVSGLVTIDQFIKIMPEYFIDDMCENTSSLLEPIVIAFDTYEKYVSFDNDTKDEHLKDSWLRKIVPFIPGVIWIISGRDRLTWSEIEKSWEVDLKQQLVGNLSPHDANKYLSAMGISDIDICNRIYQLSDGVPVYIDFCIDLYNELMASGKEPVPEDFSDSITQQFQKYKHSIPGGDVDLLEVLACLGSWSDEMVFDIAPHILTGFRRSTYSAFKRHSYIGDLEDNHYYMRDVIANNFYGITSPEVKRKTLKAGIEYSVLAISKYNLGSKDYRFYFSVFTNLLDKYRAFSTDEGEKWFIDEQERLAKEYRLQKQYKEALKIDSGVYEKLKAVLGENDLKTINSLNNIGIDYVNLKEDIKARDILEDVYHKRRTLLGQNHKDTLISLEYLAKAYLQESWNFESALMLFTEVYTRRKELLGEDDPDTINALEYQARILDEFDHYQESMREQFNEIYEKRKKIFGENHPDTVRSLYNIANNQSNLGNYEEAIKNIETVCSKSRELLGEYHPDTLDYFESMAIFYYRYGKVDTALDILKEVYEKRKETLGETNKYTKATLHNIHVAYKKLGRSDEADRIDEILKKRE